MTSTTSTSVSKDAAPRRWLRAQSGPARTAISFAIGMGALNGLLIIAQAWLLATIIDGATFHGKTMGDVAPWLFGLVGIFATRAVLVWARERLTFEAGAQVKADVRSRLIRHIQALGPVRLQSIQAGDIATTMTDGVEALEAYYARYLPQTAIATLVPLVILAVVFPLDWVSGLILAITAPLIPVFMVLVGYGAQRLNQRQWRRLARLGGHFLDVLQGLTTLKLFGAARREATLVSRLSDDYRKRTMAVFRVAFLSALVLEFFATVAIAMVAVFIGFRLLWGDLDFRTGLFALLLAPEFFIPLRTLGTHYHARMEGIGAAERIVALLEVQAPVFAQGRETLQNSSAISIRFENVTFSYEPGQPAVSDVSFEILAGERVAIVGHTGSGKSTIVNLLLGFVRPDDGHVHVNGQAMEDLDVEDWLLHVAWVPQSPRLFYGTVRDNIAMGLPNIPDGAIERACQAARAAEFIEALPRRYDTVLGEGGVGLSGGQARRIALARAFIKDARLVLMDEPTASLDAENEQAVTQALTELSQSRNRTVITIAHRLATVKQASRILVLDEGRLVEAGDYNSLLARGEHFARLVGGS